MGRKRKKNIASMTEEAASWAELEFGKRKEVSKYRSKHQRELDELAFIAKHGYCPPRYNYDD